MKSGIAILLMVLLVGCSSSEEPLPTIASLPTDDTAQSDNQVINPTATSIRGNTLDPITAILGTDDDELPIIESISDSTAIPFPTNDTSQIVNTAVPTATPLVQSSPNAAISQDVWYVNIDAPANAHACADVNCDVLATFDPVTALRVVDIVDDWHRVRLPFGGEAFVESARLFLPTSDDTAQNPITNPTAILQNPTNTWASQLQPTTIPQQPTTESIQATATPPGADDPLITPDTGQPPPGNGAPPGT